MRIKILSILFLLNLLNSCNLINRGGSDDSDSNQEAKPEEKSILTPAQKTIVDNFLAYSEGVSDPDEKETIEAFKAHGPDLKTVAEKIATNDGFDFSFIEDNNLALVDEIVIRPKKKIKSVVPLTFFTNLKSISLTGNSIEDAGPLSIISGLQSLNLSQNPLSTWKGDISESLVSVDVSYSKTGRNTLEKMFRDGLEIEINGLSWVDDAFIKSAHDKNVIVFISGKSCDVSSTPKKTIEYDIRGFDKDGNHKDGGKYDKLGFDVNGYTVSGFDKNGIHKLTRTKFSPEGWDVKGFNAAGFNKQHLHSSGGYFDSDGYDYQQYNQRGFNRAGQVRGGGTWDTEGYGADGYNAQGFRRDHQHRNGSDFDDNGYNYLGYDQNGFNSLGNHSNGSIYNDEGYDWDGYNDRGRDAAGLDRLGFNNAGFKATVDGNWRTIGGHQFLALIQVGNYFSDWTDHTGAALNGHLNQSYHSPMPGLHRPVNNYGMDQLNNFRPLPYGSGTEIYDLNGFNGTGRNFLGISRVVFNEEISRDTIRGFDGIIHENLIPVPGGGIDQLVTDFNNDCYALFDWINYRAITTRAHLEEATEELNPAPDLEGFLRKSIQTCRFLFGGSVAKNEPWVNLSINKDTTKHLVRDVDYSRELTAIQNRKNIPNYLEKVWETFKRDDLIQAYNFPDGHMTNDVKEYHIDNFFTAYRDNNNVKNRDQALFYFRLIADVVDHSTFDSLKNAGEGFGHGGGHCPDAKRQGTNQAFRLLLGDHLEMMAALDKRIREAVGGNIISKIKADVAQLKSGLFHAFVAKATLIAGGDQNSGLAATWDRNCSVAGLQIMDTPYPTMNRPLNTDRFFLDADLTGNTPNTISAGYTPTAVYAHVTQESETYKDMIKTIFGPLYILNRYEGNNIPGTGMTDHGIHKGFLLRFGLLCKGRGAVGAANPVGCQP